MIPNYEYNDPFGFHLGQWMGISLAPLDAPLGLPAPMEEGNTIPVRGRPSRTRARVRSGEGEEVGSVPSTRARPYPDPRAGGTGKARARIASRSKKNRGEDEYEDGEGEEVYEPHESEEVPEGAVRGQASGQVADYYPSPEQSGSRELEGQGTQSLPSSPPKGAEGTQSQAGPSKGRTTGSLAQLADGPEGNNARPPYPYSTLIRYAIEGSERGRLTLAELYTAVEKRFPWFTHSGAGWKNSIRHNLSLNKSFYKVPRPLTEPGKGSYWCVNPNVTDTNDGATDEPPVRTTGTSSRVHEEEAPSGEKKRRGRKKASDSTVMAPPPEAAPAERETVADTGQQEEGVYGYGGGVEFVDDRPDPTAPRTIYNHAASSSSIAPLGSLGASPSNAIFGAPTGISYYPRFPPTYRSSLGGALGRPWERQDRPYDGIFFTITMGFDFFKSSEDADTWREAHEQVNSAGHKAELSHELIAGAAAYEAAKAFEKHQAANGKPASHEKAKEIMAGFAGAFVDRIVETKGLDFIDKEKAKRHGQFIAHPTTLTPLTPTRLTAAQNYEEQLASHY
ncbi:hypothetical protein FRB99_005546 [Tulasnella sp. 403]|nr:hypothetical protein FRB99_005546 [Tulasnella sp. 403]